MRKIILLIFAFMSALGSYAQLSLESFEGTWTTGQGPANWKILQNTVGTNTVWAQSPLNNTFIPPFEGQYAAYLNRENVVTGIPEDYLVTPLFNIPSNPELHFYSRLTQAEDQGGIYKIKILPEGANADDINNYIELQSWTEIQINPAQTEYTEITLNIPQIYVGTQARIAFVMLGDNADRWLIDNVKVTSFCEAPSNLTASNLTVNSADLSWDSPSGATKWEIEYVGINQASTGTGTNYEGTLPYSVINLTASTNYKYYVRSKCNDGGISEWQGPYNFATKNYGDTCEQPLAITALPYYTTNTTANFANNYSGSAGTSCGQFEGDYLFGNDVVYSYTPTVDGVIRLNVSSISQSDSGIFVYTSCNDIGTNCYAADVFYYEEEGLEIANMNVTSGTTYYFVISNRYSQTMDYTFEIQQENCIKPHGLSVAGITDSSANIAWQEGGIATSWEFKTQIAGSGMPTTSGNLVNNPFASVNNLPESSHLEFYVRSACGSGSFSNWAGPFKFNTLCNSVDLPIYEGFNSDSDKEFCWTINNNNNDINSWTTNDWSNQFEGNQSASFTTQYDTSGVNDDFLISPKMLLTGNQVLKFRYRNPDTKPVAMQVLLSTSGIDSEDFTTQLVPLTTYYYNDNYVEKTVNLSSITGPVYIAWHIGDNVIGSQIILDNVIIDELAACPEPTDLTVVNTTTTTASLSWTQGNTESGWQVIVQSPTLPVPDSSQSGDAVSSIPYIKTGLSPNIEYVYYIRSMCGGTNSNSNWTGPFKFKTPCEAFDIPFYEGFNTGSNQDCWQILNTNNDYNQWGIYSGGFEGDGSIGLYTNATNNDWLISPAINLTGTQRLKYNFKGANAFKVLLSTTGREPQDFINVLQPQQLEANDTYLEKKISLAAFTGPVYIAWVVNSNSNNSGDLLIDNIIVEEQPLCTEPVDLTIGTITPHTAELKWTQGFTENNWEALIQPAGGIVPGETSVGEATTSNIYVKTNLDSNTTYEYYVRSTCGTNGKSIWVGPFVFTTTCDAFNVPFFEDFDSDSDTKACWQVLNEEGFYHWDINTGPFEGNQYANLETSDAVNNDWLISPGINLNGNQRLKYYQKANFSTGYKVLLSTTGRNPEDFTEVLTPETLYNNAAYVKRIASLEAYSGTVYIAWQVDTSSEYGSALFIDNVLIEDIPSCPEPTELVANVTGQGSAQLSWIANGSETEWEVLVKLSGNSLPTGNGVVATSIPFVVNTTSDGIPLQSGTGYEFYVKAICSDTDKSIWSDKQKFITVLSNDNCDSAINVPVNGTTCEVFATGTVNGATASSQAAPCWGLADDDVWFEFTATSKLHTVTLNNVNGSQESLMFAIYSGNCETLTQVDDCVTVINGSETIKTAILRELTIGQTYKIRVFTPYTDLPQNTTFNVCVKTPVAPIRVDTATFTVDELISDVLINSECDQISNITWSTGTNFGDVSGIGYFEQNGSDFPFESGIVMATGNAQKAIGPNYGKTNSGGYGWPGDSDLNEIITEGTGEQMFSANASIIEFDFVPAVATMSFDFIFASEEYGFYQCEYSDAFAFILTDDQGNKKNLAVVPGTDIPISVVTVRDIIYNLDCSSENVEYFDNYTGIEGLEDTTPISYDGVLKTLTASATVVPNTQYHIKMVVGDRTDVRLDSAVFLRAGSFNIGKPQLGEDLLVENNNAVCADGSYTLHTTLDPAKFEFEWKQDGTVINDETGPDLVVTAPGTYGVKATLIGSDCFTDADILVEFYPAVEDVTGNPVGLIACNASGFAEFDLSSNTVAILNGSTASAYTISYHASLDNAEAGTDALSINYTNTVQFEQMIYAKIVNNATGCSAIKSFKLIVQDLTPQFTIENDFSICKESTGVITVVPGNYNPDEVTYAWKLNGNELTLTSESIEVSEAGVYEVTVNNKGCTQSKTVTVTIVEPPVAQKPDDVIACESYILPALNAGNRYFKNSGATGGELFEGDVIDASTILYVFIQNTTLSDCSGESSFTITINPAPSFTLGGPYSVCNAPDFTINVNAENFNAGEASYSWTLNGTAIEGESASLQATDFGIYAVTATVNGCSSVKTVEVVKDTTTITLVFEEGCNGNDEYVLKVLPSDGSFDTDKASYTWTGPDGFTSDKQEIVVPVKGTYIVTVTTNEGCIGEDFNEVLQTSCDIPKGISPNGDGMNDNFDLSSLDVKQLKIFNRYGQEAYSQGNYTNQWHGQVNNGNELPTGTYYYVIERHNGETKTGWVYINRQD